MRTKRILRNLAWSVLAIVLMLFAVLTLNVKAPVAKASEEAQAEVVKTLFTPTATNENYKVTEFGKWSQTTTVEDYADSPTGKVVHQVVNSIGVEDKNAWPALTLNIPYDGDTSDFEGYIVWLEYEAEMYTNSDFWGLFGMYVDGVHHAGDRKITFVDVNGNITETLTGRGYYHHNNATVIEGTDYRYAYSYSFKGYMLIPKGTYSSDVTPTATSVFKMNHHNAKELSMDLKIGSIGYYTDYNGVLAELGRCEYSFVDYDGTVLKSDRVKPGSVVTAPDYENTYSSDGKVYSLIGWSGYTPNMTVSGDTVFHAVYKARNFHMVEGASVRTTEGSSGIRYMAEFDENVYNEVTLNNNKQFGMIITKYDYYLEAKAGNTDLVAGLNELGGKKYVLVTENSANPLTPYKVVGETKTMYRINGVLSNIQYSHADWEWIGIGVIITQTENGAEYFYCAYEEENVVRSMAYVASAALNNPEENFDATETATVKSYVYKAAAKLAGETEAAYNAQADKSTYLSNFELAISGGIDATYDFNANDGMKEAYLTIGESKLLSAAVQNANGTTLDVAYTVSVGDESVLSYKNGVLTALKNGYSALTTSCELFGYSNTVMVYTGSEDAGNYSNAKVRWTTGVTDAKIGTGEIGGRTYDVQFKKVNSASGWLYGVYSDISVYYIDYLLSQGYKYLRVPFYFETDKYAEIDSTQTSEGSPYITTWVSKFILNTSDGKGTDYKKVPKNEWCYYDMDLQLYRLHFSNIDGSSVDTYGQRLAVKESERYQNLIMKFSCAGSYVYMGNMTFIKSSTVEIDEGKSGVQFADVVDLNDRYEAEEKLYYTVNGEKAESLLAINNEYTVGVRANVITHKLGDGKYTLGDTNSWQVSYETFNPIEKTIEVEGGLEVSDVQLVDVNGLTTDVLATSAYTGANLLAEKGFTVTESYVKRYSDQTVVQSNEIATNERGIFYATVNATNGVQTVEYDVTLDVYSSTEPIEYESFGHADSAYAVSAYYALVDQVDVMMTSRKLAYASYDTLKANYVEGKTYNNNACYGMDLPFNDYFVLNTFGNAYKATYRDMTIGHWDDWDSSRKNLQAVYGLSGNSSAIVKAAGITYLAMDMSVINATTPIATAYANDTAISVYVTPRHTAAYYEKYASDTILKYSYTVPYYTYKKSSGWESEGDSGIIYAPTSIAEDGTPTFTKKQVWSAYFQSSIYTAQTITPQTIATHYDAFANRNFPMIVVDRPQGFSSTNTHNGVMKLGMLIF